MISLPMASILIKLVSIVWIAVAVLLILIILVQKGKGGGLGGAFGGAGGGGGLLGTKTGDFLTWVTISLVILFFFFAIILVKFGKPKLSEDLRNTPAATQPLNGMGSDENPAPGDTTDVPAGDTTDISADDDAGKTETPAPPAE